RARDCRFFEQKTLRGSSACKGGRNGRVVKRDAAIGSSCSLQESLTVLAIAENGHRLALPIRRIPAFSSDGDGRPANSNSSSGGSMRTMVSRVCVRALVAVAAVAASSVSAATAQTTVTLNQSQPQVVYASLRGCAYADKNLPTV